MFSIFKKKEAPILTVLVNGKEVCSIMKDELPVEKSPTVKCDAGSSIEFIDSEGNKTIHDLGNNSGWFHFSVRVHPNLACQADCVITDSKEFDENAFKEGKATGIRLQPFFLSGSSTDASIFIGRGLFKRGLHFNGTVTPGNTILSCVCDSCKKSFLIQSYHAGFSNSGYFYSGSGKYTITVSDHIEGSPAALSDPNKDPLSKLEGMLPEAPDGSVFSYLNPFRCPHCNVPYIDFEKYPEDRAGEYYGNYFVGSELLSYVPVHG